MSYVLITKETLRRACEARIAKAQQVYEEGMANAIEAAREVWWRKLLKLPLLTHEQAKERLKKVSAEAFFGGVLGNIAYTKHFAVEAPNRLLAATAVSDTDVVLLSSEDAIRVEQWKTLLQ